MWIQFCFTLIAGIRAQANDINYTQKQYWFTQIQNHFHVPQHERGSFQQRYWVVDDFWDAQNGPIFLYLCGEFECNGVSEYYIYPLYVAQKYKAKFYVLEHRYYGYSFPQLYSNKIPELFDFFDTEQALADIANFITSMNRDLSVIQGRKPKWITIGGSYPGALSAWFRTRYPDLTVGAWASSAIVKPVLNYSDYDYQIYLSTLRSGLDCVNSVRDIGQLAETLYQNNTLNRMTDMFNVTQAFEGYSFLHAVYYFATLSSNMVESGFRTTLCDAVSQPDDIWEKVSKLKEIAEEYVGLSANGASISYANNLTFTPEKNWRSLKWQPCTQLGYWMTASNQTMRPASIDFAYWNSTCNEIFHYSGGLPVPDLNITTTELNYKGRNIFYTYGVEDPWQWVGVRESYDESVKSVIVDCDDCAHCVDLLQPSDSDPPELKSVREQIENSIATWINYYGLDI